MSPLPGLGRISYKAEQKTERKYAPPTTADLACQSTPYRLRSAEPRSHSGGAAVDSCHDLLGSHAFRAAPVFDPHAAALVVRHGDGGARRGCGGCAWWRGRRSRPPRAFVSV